MSKMYDDENYTPKHSISTNDAQPKTEGVDYVLPVTKEKKPAKKDMTSDFDKKYGNEASDFCFAQPYNAKKENRKKVLKIFGIVMAILASLMLVLSSAVVIFNYSGKKAMHDYADMTIDVPVDEIEKLESVENSGKTIIYNGKTYAFNEKVTTVTFMGVDIKDFEKTDREVGEAGQADAIYIAVMDTSTKKLTILGVSRDAMVDVNIYNKDGEFVNTENMQLCLSYAYGDGKHTSCENTIVSLERLFYGMQFDTYFSLDTRALERLTDEVGGVTVTSLMDFYSNNENRTVYEGEEITLYGSDATTYIRSRDTKELDSNNDRMARQSQFMKAFLSKIWSTVKSNPKSVINLYNTIDDYSTTNLTTSKMVYLSSSAISMLDSYKEVEFVNIAGEVKKGEQYAEFYPDQDALMETLLDLFYIKVN